MLMMMGSASGSFAYQYVTGSLFHRYGLHCFLYVSVTCACAISIVFIVMTAIVRGKNAHDVTEMVIGVEGDALEVTYSKENESSQIKSPEDGLEVTQPLNVVETWYCWILLIFVLLWKQIIPLKLFLYSLFTPQAFQPRELMLQSVVTQKCFLYYMY